MITRTNLRRLGIWAWVLQVGLVLGATEVISPETIPLAKYLYVVTLAFVGGAASTLTRWGRGGDSADWRLIIARDFFCSELAGILTFFIALNIGSSPLMIAVYVALAGWGGSRAVEALYERFGGAKDSAAGKP